MRIKTFPRSGALGEQFPRAYQSIPELLLEADRTQDDRLAANLFYYAGLLCVNTPALGDGEACFEQARRRYPSYDPHVEGFGGAYPDLDDPYLERKREFLTRLEGAHIERGSIADIFVHKLI